MVNTKKYTPTNKRFQKHTQSFVTGKTQKGHLNNEDDKKGDVYQTEGVLKKVIRKKLYEDGWVVKVDNETKNCYYGDNIVYLPPHKTTQEYYIPTTTCKVIVNIDKKQKIYTITRMNDPNKTPISMFDEGLSLKSGDGSTELKITNDTTTLSGSNLNVDGDVKLDTKKDEDLPDEISLKELYKKVQIIETQVGGNNGTE